MDNLDDLDKDEDLSEFGEKLKSLAKFVEHQKLMDNALYGYNPADADDRREWLEFIEKNRSKPLTYV